MRNRVNRRQFSVGMAGLGALALTRPAFAQSSVRSITTPLGTYDIPTDPQRVVVIDTRLDLEPAVALGLPVVGYSYFETIEPWVPHDGKAVFIGRPPTREAVLAVDPDLIICTNLPGTEMWPIDKLTDIAPVLPVQFESDWKSILTDMGEWLGRRDRADAFIADYELELAAVKARRASVLGKKVAAIWSSPDVGEINFLLGLNSPQVTAIGQVLDDLGGVTVSTEGLGEYANISYELMGDVLGDVDAIIVDSFDAEEIEGLEKSPVWQRLPAVKAGRVVLTSGAYYGGCYTARHLLGEWDKVFALFEA